MKILLIEDDAILADVLLQALLSQRYVVDLATDGQLGWEYVRNSAYDLILMDVGLPKIDGITLCQRLRADGCVVPILLITAKEASGDRIRGLDAGADDYLIKPLDIGEFQARVRALLRRGDVSRSPVLQVGSLQLDPTACKVSYDGKPLNLTPKEYSLLELFLRNPTRVFSRGHIVEHLWTFDDPPQEDSVKAHIKGLRQRLRTVGISDWIENVYGLGYRLKEGVGKEESPSSPSSKPSGEPNTTPEPQKTEGSDVKGQQFAQAMGGLWERYQGLMVERMNILRQALQALQQGTLAVELQQSAEQAAHKLAGVLGMFEREDGTTLARQLEKLLQKDFSPEKHQDAIALIQSLETLLNLPGSVEPIASDTPSQILAEGAIAPPSPSLSPGEKLSVLAVDDDPIVLAALRALLEPWGIQVTGLENPLQFWEVWNTANPDLLILDVEMPQQSGIELCQAVRENPDCQDIPILFLTAHRDTEIVQRVFAAGADDYIVKPVVGQELLTRITHRLERTRLLQTLSTKDPLTGLANQPRSSQEMERLIQRAAQNPIPFCLVILHLIELGSINIQYGHAVGNQVLQRWGQLLKGNLPANAVLGYWGNGEFALGLPEMTQTAAQDHLSALLTTLRQQVFTAPDQTRFQVKFEVAIAAYPADGTTLHGLYQAAHRCNS